jgi:hypothetical protein
MPTLTPIEHLVTVDLEARLQRADDALRHGLGVRAPVQHQGELVTAETGAQVALAQTAAQAIGHGDEELITDEVTQRVVDQLEAIQVQEQHRGVGPVAIGAGKPVLKAVQQLGAVAQPGERIGERAQCAVVGTGDGERHLDVLPVGRHRPAVVRAPSPRLRRSDDERTDDLPELADGNADAGPRSGRRHARSGVVRRLVLHRDGLAGGDHPAAQPFGDRSASARPVRGAHRRMEGDGHHPAGIVLVHEAQHSTLAPEQPEGPVEHRLVDERRRRLLGYEGVNAGHRVDEWRLEMDAGGGRGA